MDENSDKNIELIEFLNQEKLNKKIPSKKIHLYFNKCIIKSLIELETKFSNVKNKDFYILNGCNMIFYIYFILIFYTNNIKLTLFLMDRSILFYTEFIIMSQDKKLIDQICFIPNINDALFFTYKKTVGPIEFCNIKLKSEQVSVRDLCYTIRSIYKEILLCNKSNNINTKFLNDIHSNISEPFYKLYISVNSKQQKNEVSYSIDEILNFEIDLNLKLLLIKFFLTNSNKYNVKEISKLIRENYMYEDDQNVESLNDLKINSLINKY
jgi:hypothetical protein